MKTLTAANSVILITVPSLFPIPQQLQGYAADDVFDIDGLATSEVQMGVDGKLSAGWVPQAVVQNITLQADSDSIAVFEALYAAQQLAQEVYPIVGLVRLPAVKRTYSMPKGFLTNYAPIANGKKVLQARRFQITWETITAAPF